jgi:RHS repeat-associated protein
MRHNYTYQAFGEIDRQSGSTQNSYLFTGEQLDRNANGYYLRQRYYDFSTGRFNRIDMYEGLRREPLTLHKYMYAQLNPINLTDPSGLTPQNRGNQVAAVIKLDFWVKDPLGRAAEQRIDTDIWRRLQINRSNVPTQIVPRRLRDGRPDMVDYTNQQLYEIGTLNERFIKLRKMQEQYLPAVNNALISQGRPANWTGGDIYNPPPIIINADRSIARVYPPTEGVISYQIINDGTLLSVMVLTIELSTLIAGYISLLAATRGLAI